MMQKLEVMAQFQRIMKNHEKIKYSFQMCILLTQVALRRLLSTSFPESA